MMRAARLAIVAALALGTLTSSNAAQAQPTCNIPTVAAHRGDSQDYTQSTLAAFVGAYNAGAKVWETDVHFTVTGYPVLLHDDDMAAFGGPGVAINSISVKQADAYRSPTGAEIETLHQLAQQMVEYPDAKALVELKVAPTAIEWQRVAEWLQPLGRRVWVASAIVGVTEAAQARGYQTAQIDNSHVTRSVTAVAALGSGYERDLGRLTPAIVESLHVQGVSVYAWTVNTPTDWAKTVADGALPLTDNPAGFVRWYRYTYCQEVSP